EKRKEGRYLMDVLVCPNENKMSVLVEGNEGRERDESMLGRARNAATENVFVQFPPPLGVCLRLRHAALEEKAVEMKALAIVKYIYCLFVECACGHIQSFCFQTHFLCDIFEGNVFTC